MPLYMISYQAESPETRTVATRQIHQLPGEAWNPIGDVWLMESHLPGRHIRDALKAAIGARSKVLVALMAGWAAWHGFEGKSSDWLESHL